MDLKLVPPWKRLPFLKVLIPFTCGILLQYYLKQSELRILITLLLLAILLAVTSTLQYYRLRRFFGILLHLALLVIGALAITWQDYQRNPDWIGHSLLQEPLLIQLKEQPHATANGSKALASILCSQSTYRTGLLMLYFEKEVPKQVRGSRLIITAKVERIPANHNPGGFNYQQYSSNKGIYHQSFLQKNNYQFLPTENISWISKTLQFLQDHVTKTFRSYLDEKNVGLAEALMIGYKYDLDRNLLKDYSNTGVVHIIAISGLHLALLYLIIDKLISTFFRKRSPARAILILLTLWIFTLLAGATPSVVRSAVMFSVLVMGELLDRKSSLLNNLSASAFLLLCYDPYWLWDLGFQLSFTAVLGLALWSKPIAGLVYTRNKLLNELWKMSSVTLAAQLSTLPLLLYNFGQFPVFFLPANLIAVPLSSTALVLEMILCFTAPFPAISRILAWLIDHTLTGMNAVVHFFGSSSYSLLRPIHLDSLQKLLEMVFL
jgi:competence protein ComEC